MNALRNSPAAATVLARHLVRGSDRVAALPQPWRRGSYSDALAALAEGDLTAAGEHARSAGVAGRLLREHVAGEIALLTQPLVTERPAQFRPATVPDAPTVLHLVTNALPEIQAGYTLRTQGLARAQLERGTRVDVATRLGFPVTAGHLRAEQRVQVDGVRHHRQLPFRLPLRADDALRLDVERTATLVRRLRPDLLHAHSNHVNAQVALALRARFGIPVVYEARGFLEETWRSRFPELSAQPSAKYINERTRTDEREAYRLARQRETECLQAADAVVTLSNAMRAAIIERGVPAERVHVVANGVDHRFLEHVPQPRTAGPLTVGVVGTLNRYEGVDVLLRALALLPETRALIVGDGPARAALEGLTADLGLGDRVTFTGRIPHAEVPAAYASIDVYAAPRLDLPVTRLVPPLKPVEAMALGRPVVASDLAPLRELVGSGQQRGVLVPPGDPAALAGAIAALEADPARRTRTGAAARAWVTTTRTWHIAAETCAAIYRSTRGETR